MRIITVLTFLCLAASSYAQNTDQLFLETFKKRWANAKTSTIKVAELMPADHYNFKPTPEEMSFGEQLIHITGNISRLTAQYLKKEKNPFQEIKADDLSKEKVIQRVSDAFDYAMKALDTFSTQHLADSVRFFAGPMTKLQVINLLNDHQTHHRGQLIVYLRLQGIKPPAYVGW